MILYVLRHAIAQERRPGRPDATRALTDEGREKLARVLKQARRSGVKPTVILSSPLVRAVQTAQLAAEALDYHSDIVETPALAPKASAAATWEALRQYQGQPEILISGHEPHLSGFIAFALAAPGLKLELKKSALACIHLDRRARTPHGILEWILTPKTVR